MRELEHITIEGFRSIKSQTLQLKRLNLVIGANGVGKSNLVNAFRFLHDIYREQLQTLSVSGNPATYFFHGPKVTPEIHLKAKFTYQEKLNAVEYAVAIGFGDAGLFVKNESVSYQHVPGHSTEPSNGSISLAPSKESSLRNINEPSTKLFAKDVAAYRVYHLADTSRTAGVKQPSKIDDNRALAADASNLASMLLLFKQKFPDHFNLIESTIKQIAPFFDGFVVEPLRANPEMIKLEWRERGSDDYFDGHSLSDGTLRFMCLATLLLQPEAPRLILLDEPELGLHPAAINVLAALLRQASVNSQILLATQSVTLINQFQPEDVLVAERENGATVFNRLNSENYANWMEEYSLGEMWEKNLIGGRP
jgi:predicted ATPase